MPHDFPYDVFLSHSSKDKAVVRPLAERLRADGLKVWPVAPKRPRAGGFDKWVLRPGDSIPAKIDPPSLRSFGGTRAGLEHTRVLPLAHRMGEGARRAGEGISAITFGSDWARWEAGTCGRLNLPFRDPLNQERRFMPLRLDGIRQTRRVGEYRVLFELVGTRIVVYTLGARKDIYR